MEESAGLALQTGEHFKLPKERLLNFWPWDTHGFTSYEVHAQKPQEGDGSVDLFCISKRKDLTSNPPTHPASLDKSKLPIQWDPLSQDNEVEDNK